MEIRILGPLDVRDREGRTVVLPAGRERSLLALLVIHHGEVVSVDRIVDALWGGTPPGTAAKAVQGYVSHLRRALEPDREPGDGNSVLVTRPPGYALRQADMAVDAVQFEHLASEGRRASRTDRPGRQRACSKMGWRCGEGRRSSSLRSTSSRRTRFAVSRSCASLRPRTDSSRFFASVAMRNLPASSTSS